MIHLINSQTRRLYTEDCEALHRARFHHFVEGRGWPLDHVDGQEVDAYDDALAHHLIGFTSEGRIAVSCRIRPTFPNGLIPDRFPHLVADHEPPVRTPGVYECTRYFSAEHLRGRAGFLARSRLHVAMIELIQDLGGHRLLGFVDLPFLAHLRRFSGLRLRPVGLPAAYEEGGEAIAFEIGVLTDDLAHTRAVLDLPGRQLFAAPPWMPIGLSPHRIAPALDVLINGDDDDARALTGLANALSTRKAVIGHAEQVFERLASPA